MARNKHQEDLSPSPEERYRELEQESAEWSERVDRSVRKLDRVTKDAKASEASQHRARRATPA